MQVIHVENSIHIIRVEKGEELVETILAYCQKEAITSAWIQALGAGDKAKLSYYNLAKKEYVHRTFEEAFEILSILGNVATVNGKLGLHAHATLSNEQYTSFGGHLQSLRISGTGEVHIQVFNVPLNRSYDEVTGLMLLQSPKRV